MPRTRWAVPCRAHRSDGQPCGAWAIRGVGTHGGASPNARATARERLVQDDFHRAYEGERRAYEQRLRGWQVTRIVAAAELLDMDPARVAAAPVLVGFAEYWHHAVPPAEPTMRSDRRYRAHRPDVMALPAIPGARMRTPAAGRHLPGCPGWPRPGGRPCLEELRPLLRGEDTQK